MNFFRAHILFSFLPILILNSNSCQQLSNRHSKKIQDKTKYNILLVLAHPDDETLMAATLAKYRESISTIDAIYLTSGEGGRDIRIPKENWSSTDPQKIQQQKLELKSERIFELNQVKKELPITNLWVLQFPDTPLRIPEENYPHPKGRPTSDLELFLKKGPWKKIWNREIDRAKKLVNLEKYNYVFTLSQFPNIVHAHHQAAFRFTIDLFDIRTRKNNRNFKRPIQENVSLIQSFPKLFGIYSFQELQWYPSHLFPKRVNRQATIIEDYVEEVLKIASIHKSQNVSQKNAAFFMQFLEIYDPIYLRKPL